MFRQNNRIATIHQVMVTEDAVQHYRSVTGNRLKHISVFGIDLLDGFHDSQEIRAREVETKVGSFSDVFQKVVNGDRQLLYDAIDCFRSCTLRLSRGPH